MTGVILAAFHYGVGASRLTAARRARLSTVATVDLEAHRSTYYEGWSRVISTTGGVTPMRRIVMFNWATADGYFAGPDGNLDWIVPDEEQARTAAEGIPGFDTVVFGRRTYELFEQFWRRALDDTSTAPNPHRPGQRTREHRAIAVWLNETSKVVFSRTLKAVTWKNSQVLHELDPGVIANTKRQPGRDLIVFGSGSIVSQLTQHGLIDEYQFVVCPVLLGSGRQLFTGMPKGVRLDLLEAKNYRSGDVLLRYARSNQ